MLLLWIRIGTKNIEYKFNLSNEVAYSECVVLKLLIWREMQRRIDEMFLIFFLLRMQFMEVSLCRIPSESAQTSVTLRHKYNR